ncbi:succinate dehydrogenase, hydrophobic membrane anchor protein [Sphingorhabdus lutea]|uniref:Succinate dehydrogenase hydrophobic membrane anchor subunit n=1 Tax=Sphingorhabdus lutea TaxID=1913578 RepID=A0A1L3JD65_9SPHN|nr:succinate dehydrogenase, hydrophobic membrane anchor protein [Sphingorhabdus lutea]APG63068.1 succinate dehydrogenase, hydrophobic membrane anchor protein [Sphingorhabdus lutea]
MGNGTGIGRVRGLGSAKSGAHHWLVQRFTALTNALLMGWLIASLLMLPNYEYETLAGWLSMPLVAVPMILMVASIFWHIKLGMQVLIEDYVHDDGLKIGAMALLYIYAIGGSVFGIFVITKLAFAGVPA